MIARRWVARLHFNECDRTNAATLLAPVPASETPRQFADRVMGAHHPSFPWLACMRVSFAAEEDVMPDRVIGD